MDFKLRSYEKELLDGNNIPFKDIKRNMQELDFINHYLGGHKVTLKGIKNLLKYSNKGNEISIVEIGCGGGDNLRIIQQWAAKNKIKVQLTGIDINSDCIHFAKEANSGITFICSDYKAVDFINKPHIIFSSLFCHHFTDDEIVEILQWMDYNSRIGFFINDLHRHSLAYYSIKWMTRFFSDSYLVKNDAPLSVKRSFIKRDWTRFFNSAGISHFNYHWQWAFRWLVICTKS